MNGVLTNQDETGTQSQCEVLDEISIDNTSIYDMM